MSKTILVIDDADAIRKSVGFTLQEENYDVIEAEDGQVALNTLEEDEIDLIVCDVNMPVMDGITFLRNIKTNDSYSSFKYTPIIMLTTEAGEDMKAEGVKLGASAWINKPFKPDKLLKAVKMLIT